MRFDLSLVAVIYLLAGCSLAYGQGNSISTTEIPLQYREEAAKRLAAMNESIRFSERGEDASIKGNLVSAEALYKKALEVDKDNAIAQFDLGKLYESQNKISSALKIYRILFRTNPSSGSSVPSELNPRLHYILVLIRSRELEEAVHIYQKMLTTNSEMVWYSFLNQSFEPDSSEIRRIEAAVQIMLGFNYASFDSSTDAEKLAHLQKGIKLEPQLSAFQFNYGKGMAALHKIPEAKAAFKRAILLSATGSELKAKAQEALRDVDWKPQYIVIPADPKQKPYLVDPNK